MPYPGAPRFNGRVQLEGVRLIVEIVSAGRRISPFTLSEGVPIVLGRHRDCDSVLPDPHVSRRHLELELNADGRVRVQSLSPKNPVQIGTGAASDRTLSGSEWIRPGMRVTLGETTLVFRAGPAIADSVSAGDETASVRFLADRPSPLDSGTLSPAVSGSLSVSGDRFEVDADAATQWLAEESVRDGLADPDFRNKLESIYRLAEGISGSPDRESLVDRALELLFDVLPAERGFVAVGDPAVRGSSDPDSGELGFEFIRVRGLLEGTGRSIDMSQTILDEIQAQRRGLLIRDVPEELGDEAGPSVERLGIRSLLCAPLILGGDFQGFVYLDQGQDFLSEDPSRRRFTPHDLEYLQGVARLLAVALDDVSLRDTLHRENVQFRQVLRRRSEIVADSPIMLALLERVVRVAERDSTVLILGETGTGKELIARTIHDRSSRASGPFVAFNCGLSNPALIESELFGHAKGAFTDAARDHKGKFALADGGTLFLDEIGEMPPETQVKLLRVLQERQVWPVGSEAPVAVDLRLVAATHRDLEQLRDEGQFREDLYYRIAVLTIELPRLADRGDDVLVIARSLLAEEFQFDPAAERALLQYSWPGNVRELQNAVEQASFNARGRRIKLSDLPASVAKEGRRDRVEIPLTTLSEVEERAIRRTLKALGGNKKRTAEMLGISRETLYQKLKLYKV